MFGVLAVLLAVLLVAVSLCVGCGSSPTVPSASEMAGVKASASRYLTSAGKELATGRADGATLYSVQASLDPSSAVVSGTESVLYTNRSSDALSEVVFRVFAAEADGSSSARPTTITGVKVDGEDSKAALEGTVMTVDLPEEIAPKERATISFSFNEPVPTVENDITAGLFTHDASTYDLGNFLPTVVPYSGGKWDERAPSEYADVNFFESSYYDVSFKAPESYVVSATGVGTKAEGGARRFVAGPVRDFAVQASKIYQSARRKVGSTEVTSYYFEGESRAGRKALDAGCKALEAFTSHIGPYPYARMNICEGLLEDYGMEYSGLVVISSDMYGDPADEDDLEITVAHEVLHEWFALAVGSDAIGNSWLDESLVSFGEVLYSQWVHGPEAAHEALMVLADLYTSTRDDEVDDAPVEQAASAFADPNQYTAMVYGKGAVFFNALYEMMGEAAFVKSLSDYYRGKAFGLATTEDLLAAFRANSPDPSAVDRLYQRWIKETHGDEDVPEQ